MVNGEWRISYHLTFNIHHSTFLENCYAKDEDKQIGCQTFSYNEKWQNCEVQSVWEASLYGQISQTQTPLKESDAGRRG